MSDEGDEGGEGGEGGEVRWDGVSLHEVLFAGSGLYDVMTTSGVPVRLHEMSLVDLRHDEDRRRLVVQFLYDDPAWTPEQARATPLAVFTFDDVEVLQQEDEPAEPGTPPDVLGEVHWFGYDPASGVFDLCACTTWWVFRASSVSLTMRPVGGG